MPQHPKTWTHCMLRVTSGTVKWDVNIIPTTVSWRRPAQVIAAGPGELPPVKMDQGSIRIFRL